MTGELPLSLVFLQRGSAASASDSFCRFWIILNYILASSGLWTMAFTSIQRYWLVFHRTFFDRHRWFFHYIPMTCCILYPMILYICLLMMYPCQNQFDYSQWTCGGPCYLYEVDRTTNLCEMIDLFSLAYSWNLGLDDQHLFQRFAEYARHFDHHRPGSTAETSGDHSAICLESKSSDHYSIDFAFHALHHRLAPCVICSVITIFTPVPFISALNSAYLSYYQYLASLLCPLVCLLGLPELRDKLRICKKVRPQIFGATQHTLQRLETHRHHQQK